MSLITFVTIIKLNDKSDICNQNQKHLKLKTITIQAVTNNLREK